MTDNRKTTVPGASVGADAVQSSDKITTNIITNSGKQINLQAAKKSNNFGLNTVSMTELYDTVYPPRKPIVNDLLYSGTYLFVGAPKVGKSFFMGQLAYHVAMGLPLWEYEVHQGTVLYLALEDDYARLQRRLSRMFGVEETSNLYFATQAKSVSEGLDQQLEGFIREHPDVRLIIIDTLQKVREIGGDRYSYASDYEIVTKLKTFSDRYGICLLVVHHTRKMEAEDSFDMISGTNGLLGAADGAFIMQKKRRTDNTALLDIVGRDQPDQELTLEFNRERCVWEFQGAETELWKLPPDPLLEAVAKMLTPEQPEWSGHVGFVPNYVKELGFSTDKIAILCGPPIMIKFTLAGLCEIGFDKTQIYTTMELRMKCGIGKCGRCNIGSKYVCKDGPVFRCDELDALPNEY